VHVWASVLVRILNRVEGDLGANSWDNVSPFAAGIRIQRIGGFSLTGRGWLMEANASSNHVVVFDQAAHSRKSRRVT
jgi:hypothetical protein